MDNPAPDQYQIKTSIGAGGPTYQFGSRFDDRRFFATTKPDGSRFDSSLRSKPHLKPKKVDGPGPGDYRLRDSVQTRHRATKSAQISTWGTGRGQDYDPNKKKEHFMLPGPAHYNHVYTDRHGVKKEHQVEGYGFCKSMRDIQK